ncbi:hypothetical protein HYX18_03865, partial [Candidatus Woesearchaeota archaeon]|nr:hypothetical protein [Candidatus Woesearchaeota archaeon]
MGSILIILNKPKITGFVVYKSENFTNETTSAINKNLLNINEIITESTTTLTNLTNITDLVNVTSGDINVNISNQAIPKLSYVTFDRLLDCQGCGLHRAPGLTIVNMTISISVNGTLNNVTIKDYFSNDWTVVNGGNAVVKRINQTTSEIAWNLESIN